MHRVICRPLHVGCRAGDQDKRRKRGDARRGMLEQAEQFKDDDMNVSHVVRLSVWEQFARVIREVYDKSVKYSDFLDHDVALLKSRFGLPVAVGFDCRRHLVDSALPSVCFCNNLRRCSLWSTLCFCFGCPSPSAWFSGATSSTPTSSECECQSRRACACAGDRDGSVRSFTVVPLWQPSLVAASGAVLFFIGMCASVAWVLYRWGINV